MWFLTHEGVDRYDGKEFKRYKLMDDGEELNSLLNLNWLYLDHESTLWEIGKKGKVFRYDPLRDQFTLVYKLPEEKIKDRPAPISYSFIDRNNNIWLCNEETLYLYNTHTLQTLQIKNEIGEDITDNRTDRRYSLLYRYGTRYPSCGVEESRATFASLRQTR